jgi:cobalt-zinc-cadmium efflux system membrane fusion protein
MKKRTLMAMVAAVAAAVALAPGGCGKSGSGAAAGAGGCPHDIKKEKCPFCTPSLVASDGFCAEHGVAEALCYQCRPYLTTAFKKKGDWCKEHEAPDSQCVVCHPELKEKMGEGHGAPAPGGG